jgi:integrase
MRSPYLLRKRGRAWYYRLAGQKTYHSTGLTDRGKAVAFAMSKVAEGEQAAIITLDAFAKDFFRWGFCTWIAKQHAKGRPFSRAVADDTRAIVDNHILPRFGALPLAEITKAAVENWLVTLPLANATRNHLLYTLRMILREAKDARLIKENPLQEPEPFGRDYRPRDVFSAAELRLLFPADLAAVWRFRWRGLFFLLLASTGIRSGEARALSWRQILWAEGALLIDRAVKGGDMEIGQTKTGETRVVLLPSRTLAELAAWRREQQWNEPDDLVFMGAVDRRIPMSAGAVSHSFIPALARAGISRAGRNLVVHSFRHTYNTMLKRTVPAETLRALTGHKSEAMSERYDHPELADRVSALEPARSVVEKLLS